MPTREDLLADIRASEEADREVIAFEEACEAGYEGTLAEFRRNMSAIRPTPEDEGNDGLEDIPF